MRVHPCLVLPVQKYEDVWAASAQRGRSRKDIHVDDPATPSKQDRGPRKWHRLSLQHDESGLNAKEAVVLVAIVTEGAEEDDGVYQKTQPRSRFWRWSRGLTSRSDPRRDISQDGRNVSSKAGEFGKSHGSSLPSQLFHPAAKAQQTESHAGAPQSNDAPRRIRGRRLEQELLAGEEVEMTGRWRATVEQNVKDGRGNNLRSTCLARLESAATLGFDQLRRRHVSDVEELFGRVEFSLGSASEEKGEPRGYMQKPSCSAGLPIRTRVKRSGKECVAHAAGDAGGETTSSVTDDGLIELMYHYGR